ncbi:MAG: hypothetical protein R6X12_02255 [bacterium]
MTATAFLCPASGLTGLAVPHAHVHVIPRYRGDLTDPEGGLRGVIPERRRYR